MGSFRALLRTLDRCLGAGAPGLAGPQQGEVVHALNVYENDFRELLSRRPRSAADKQKVLTKEVSLPGVPSVSLDDRDVGVALKLSREYDANELDCVALLVAANQEFGLADRDGDEIFRLGAGVWLAERTAILQSLLLLLKAATLDSSHLDPALTDLLRKYCTSLLRPQGPGDQAQGRAQGVPQGLRAAILAQLRALNRPDAGGLGEGGGLDGLASGGLAGGQPGLTAGGTPAGGTPDFSLAAPGKAPGTPGVDGGGTGGEAGGVERHVMDAFGALELRAVVVQRQRLLLAQCLALSGLLTRIERQEALDITGMLQDCARQWAAAQSDAESSVLFQIACALMLCLVQCLTSDALSRASDPLPPLLSGDAAFARQLSDLVLQEIPDPSLDIVPASTSVVPAGFQGPLGTGAGGGASGAAQGASGGGARSDSFMCVARLALAAFLAVTETEVAPPGPGGATPANGRATGGGMGAGAPGVGPGEPLTRDDVISLCLRPAYISRACGLLRTFLRRPGCAPPHPDSHPTQGAPLGIPGQEDPDVRFMEVAYLHKLITCLLSSAPTVEVVRSLRLAALEVPETPPPPSARQQRGISESSAGRAGLGLYGQAGGTPGGHLQHQYQQHYLQQQQYQQYQQQQQQFQGYQGQGQGGAEASVEDAEEAEEREERKAAARAFLALLGFVGAVYEWAPELAVGNSVLWQFVVFAGEEQAGYATMIPFLRFLASLARGSPEGAAQVYDLLQRQHLRVVSWQALFHTIRAYDTQLREHAHRVAVPHPTFQDPRYAPGAHPHPHPHHPTIAAPSLAFQQPSGAFRFPAADASALEAFLEVLRAVVEGGRGLPALEGAGAGGVPGVGPGQWFPAEAYESLFCLLPYAELPSSLKAALRYAIAAFLPPDSPPKALVDKTFGLLMYYDLPPISTTASPQGAGAPGVGGTGAGAGRGGAGSFDMRAELNRVEASGEEYPSTLSYLHLNQALFAARPLAHPQRLAEFSAFVRGDVFGAYAQRPYARASQKWQLLSASLRHFAWLLRFLRWHLRALRKQQIPTPSSQPQSQSQSQSQAAGAAAELWRSPGMPLMRELLSGGVALRNLLGILGAGPEPLLALHSAATSGALREAAGAPGAASGAQNGAGANGSDGVGTGAGGGGAGGAGAGAGEGAEEEGEGEGLFGAVGPGEGAFWGAALAAEEEQQKVLGEAEETVALGFRVLLLALSLDRPLIREASTSSSGMAAGAKALSGGSLGVGGGGGGGGMLPLEQLLLREPRNLVSLLAFVRYTPSEEIQRSAVRVLAELSARGVPLVALFLEFGVDADIREDYADCLQLSLASPTGYTNGAPGGSAGEAAWGSEGEGPGAGGEGEWGPEGEGEGEEGEEEVGEGRDMGALILRFLLEDVQRGNVASPRPSHLLLGFDVQRPIPGTDLHHEVFLRRTPSCLSALLTFVAAAAGADAAAAASDPDLEGGAAGNADPAHRGRAELMKEMAFQLLFVLASDSLTARPVRALLQRPECEALVLLLEDGAASRKLPALPALRVSALRQRAWLMQMYALLLLASNPSESQQLDTCLRIVEAFFAPAPPLEPEDALGTPGGAGTWPNGTSNSNSNSSGELPVLAALGELLTVALPELPQAPPASSKALEAAQGALAVHRTLALAVPVEEGGVYALSLRGDRLISLGALRDSLWAHLQAAEPAPGAPAHPLQPPTLQTPSYPSPFGAGAPGGYQSGERGEGGAGLEALAEAAKECLKWAAQRNAVEAQRAAQLHAVQAWAQLALTAVSLRLGLLPPDLQMLSVSTLLLQVLAACAAPDTHPRVAHVLSQVPVACMVRLQSLTGASSRPSAAPDAGYTGGVPVDGSPALSRPGAPGTPGLPLRLCQETLGALLSALTRPDIKEVARRRYYVALLTYFNTCKLADAELDWTPAVMAAVLPSLEAGDSVLDIQRVEYERRELRRTNVALLLRADPGPLFSTLARDAAHASDLAQALAATLLAAALTEASSGAAAGPSAGAPTPLVYPGQAPGGFTARGGDAASAASGILGQLQSRGVVQACISGVSADLSKALGVATPQALRRQYVVEARLSLLLSVAAMPSHSGPAVLFSMGLLRALSSCRALGAAFALSRARGTRWAGGAPGAFGGGAGGGAGVGAGAEVGGQLVSSVLRLVLSICHLVSPDGAPGASRGPTDRDRLGSASGAGAGGTSLGALSVPRADVLSQLVEFAANQEPLFLEIIQAGMQDQEPDLDLVWQATAILGSILPCVGPTELSGLRALLGEALLQWLVPDVNSGVPCVCARGAARSQEAALDAAGGMPLGGEGTPALDLGVLRVRAHLALFLRALVARGARLAPSEGEEEVSGKAFPPGPTGGSQGLDAFSGGAPGANGSAAREWGAKGLPSLRLLAELLDQCVVDLQGASEARAGAISKMMDVNEMSAHEVEDTLKCLQVLPNVEPRQTAGAGSAGAGLEGQGQLALPPGSRQLASMTLRQKRHAALMALARLASTRERHMEQSVLAAETSLDVLLTHFMAVRDAPGVPAANQGQLNGFGGPALGGSSSLSQRFTLGIEGQLPSLERLARQLLPILERILSLREETAGANIGGLLRLSTSLRSLLLLAFP